MNKIIFLIFTLILSIVSTSVVAEDVIIPWNESINSNIDRTSAYSFQTYAVTSYEMTRPEIKAGKWITFARYDFDNNYEICYFDIEGDSLQSYELNNENYLVNDVYGSSEFIYWLEFVDIPSIQWELISMNKQSKERTVIRSSTQMTKAAIPRVHYSEGFLVWMETEYSGDGYRFYILAYVEKTGEIKRICERNYVLSSTVQIKTNNGKVAFPDKIEDEWYVLVVDLDTKIVSDRFHFGKRIPENVTLFGELISFIILQDETWSSGTPFLYDISNKQLTNLSLNGEYEQGWLLDMTSNHVLNMNVFSKDSVRLYNISTNTTNTLCDMMGYANIDLFVGSIDENAVACIGVPRPDSISITQDNTISGDILFVFDLSKEVMK